jgi:hypothetical protein
MASETIHLGLKLSKPLGNCCITGHIRISFED